MAEKVYFTDAHIELVMEVNRNPELKSIILKERPADTLEALGHICAYLNIAIDGYYSQQEIDDLTEELVLQLRDRRASI